MATIHCPGGHIFSDNTDPNPLKSYLIPDEVGETLVSKILDIMKTSDDPEPAIHHLILTAGSEVYTCPYCGRLIVISEDGSATHSYVPEEMPEKVQG